MNVESFVHWMRYEHLEVVVKKHNSKTIRADRKLSHFTEAIVFIVTEKEAMHKFKELKFYR